MATLTKDAAIKALKKLQEIASSPDVLELLPDTRFGICGNWNELLGEFSCTGAGYKLVTELARGWEKHSGDANYPVDSCLAAVMDGGKRKWEGKNLVLRQELIQHILTKLETLSEEDFLKIR